MFHWFSHCPSYGYSASFAFYLKFYGLDLEDLAPGKAAAFPAAWVSFLWPPPSKLTALGSLQLGSAESCHLFSCCLSSVALSLATCCDPAVACGMGAVTHPGVASAAGSGQDGALQLVPVLMATWVCPSPLSPAYS